MGSALRRSEIAIRWRIEEYSAGPASISHFAGTDISLHGRGPSCRALACRPCDLRRRVMSRCRRDRRTAWRRTRRRATPATKVTFPGWPYPGDNYVDMSPIGDPDGPGPQARDHAQLPQLIALGRACWIAPESCRTRLREGVTAVPVLDAPTVTTLIAWPPHSRSRGAVGDDLVGVHVRGGAGPALDGVDDELVAQPPGADLLARADDRFGDVRGGRPRSRLARAAACLTDASAAIRSGNCAMVDPVIVKFSIARTVCTP